MSSPPTPSTGSDGATPSGRSRRAFPTSRSRRAFLAAAGTGAASALAGCSVLQDDPDPAPFHDGDWHSYGNAPHNRNRAAGGAPAPGERTVLAAADWPYVPPVVHEGVAYFASGQDVLAVERDGTDAWSWRTDHHHHEVAGAPALDPDRDRLYVPTRDAASVADADPPAATVLAFPIDDGEPAWTARVGDDRAYGVTVHDGDVFARSTTACVRLAPDGTERWQRPLQPLTYDEYNLSETTATQVSPAVVDDGVYVPDRHALVKLDLATGEERWRVDANAPYSAPVVDDDGGVVQTGWRGTVAVTSAGDVRWRRDLHSLAAPAVDGDDVYVVANDFHALDAETGETNWQTHLSSDGTAAPVVTDDSVVVVSSQPIAFRRDVDGVLGPGRERWRATATHAHEYASPVIGAGRLFVVGSPGLIALDAATDQ